MSRSHSEARRNAGGQVRLSVKLSRVKRERNRADNRGRTEVPKDEGCVWFVWHKCTSVWCRWHSDSCPCLSMFQACLIFRIYPPGPPSRCHHPAPTCYKSPKWHWEHSAGTKYYLITQDYGPGHLGTRGDTAVSVARAAQLLSSLSSWYFMVTKMLGVSRCLTVTPGDGEGCERVLIRSE